ncbi:MAG: metalloprotease [Nanoarchaeota archaeon]|nr:metalloprotease [Nanoarchaeota archaeon]
MKFSSKEVKDLVYAGLLISLAFAILLAGGYEALISLDAGLSVAFIISFFTAGIGFLLHELMHKYVAQGYGLQAEFRAFYNMLWLALLFSLFGFIFAAPGAVFIQGRITTQRNGKISLAGPLTNIILAILFLIGVLIYGKEGILGFFFFIGLTINSLLGAFNMIPVIPFDGGKIITWNKPVYWVTVIVAVGLWIISWII